MLLFNILFRGVSIIFTKKKEKMFYVFIMPLFSRELIKKNLIVHMKKNFMKIERRKISIDMNKIKCIKS